MKKGKLQMELIATHFAFILLALASALKVPLLSHNRQPSLFLDKVTYTLLLIATFFLSFSLLLNWRDSGFVDSTQELLFLVILSSLSALLLPIIKVPLLSWMASPLLTTVLAIHLARDGERMHTSTFVNPYLSCHIAGAIAGEILAVIAAGFAIFYLGQHRLLKEKRFAHLIRKVPALDLLDDCLIVALSAGFLFLSIALISGAIFLLNSNAEDFSKWTLKLIWALSIWFWYLAALFSRIVLHVSAKKLAQMSLLGFCFLVASYFGFIF